MTRQPTWDPGQYLRYADDRARPFADLLARVPVERAALVVDLGCGPGTLTERLAARWPDAEVIGVDSSAEMVDAAAARASDRVSFARADLRDWEPPGPVDVILANAVLHWLADPLALVARFAGWLAPGGAVAVQVPGNGRSPGHTVAAALVDEPAWRDRLGAAILADTDVDPRAYLDSLLAAGLAADVWETTYLHVLTGDDPVLEWLKGSTLRPVLDRLDPAEGEAFCAELAHRLRAAYPATGHGVVYPFRRVFAIGHRAPDR